RSAACRGRREQARHAGQRHTRQRTGAWEHGPDSRRGPGKSWLPYAPWGRVEHDWGRRAEFSCVEQPECWTWLEPQPELTGRQIYRRFHQSLNLKEAFHHVLHISWLLRCPHSRYPRQAHHYHPGAGTHLSVL